MREKSSVLLVRLPRVPHAAAPHELRNGLRSCNVRIGSVGRRLKEVTGRGTVAISDAKCRLTIAITAPAGLAEPAPIATTRFVAVAGFYPSGLCKPNEEIAANFQPRSIEHEQSYISEAVNDLYSFVDGLTRP